MGYQNKFIFYRDKGQIMVWVKYLKRCKYVCYQGCLCFMHKCIKNQQNSLNKQFYLNRNCLLVKDRINFKKN